jgi:hypothetical protein
MALRQNEPVTLSPLRMTRVVAHVVKVKRGHYVYTAQAAPGVSRTCFGNHSHNIPPHLRGYALHQNQRGLLTRAREINPSHLLGDINHRRPLEAATEKGSPDGQMP